MPKFRTWEWIALAAAGLIISVAAPLSDYRQDLAAQCLRSVPLFLVLMWAVPRAIDLALRRHWRPAATCLSIAIAAVMLFTTGQSIGDYLEVHWASHSLSSAIDENHRHVAAQKVYGNVTGNVSYIVFDPADAGTPIVERTISDTQNLCVRGLRTIGDHFYLVNGVAKPCR